MDLEKGGLDCQEIGPVILAAVGCGADFTQQSLLAQYRPYQGEGRQGDDIKMGEAIS